MFFRFGKLSKSIFFLFLTSQTQNLFATTNESIIIRGSFRCGNGVVDNQILLNCGNAYLHALNFEGNPHIHATALIQSSGQFQLEIPIVKTENSVNEMTFILRSLDEDRVLGIFYRIDQNTEGGLTESFYLNSSKDFGPLKISRKREIIISD